MGLGIAFDVAVATVARFRNEAQTWKSWTLPVTATHILFPAFGYYSWWFFGSVAPILLTPLGLLAAVIVGLFLYEAFCDWINEKPVFALSSLTDALLPDTTAGQQAGIIVIAAVSMDALFSGPAKAAQAEVAGWTGMEIAISFLVAGAVVAIVAQMALMVANWLRGIKFTNLKTLAYWCLGGKYLEAAVIGGFGVLSLWSGVSFWLGGANLEMAIAIAGGLFAMLFFIFRRRLYDEQILTFTK